ncbi:E3 ubiquitin-protein ligase COP1-like [Gossypium australe]|uniref:E3 ubiquitin-protein ligase COP1-like n=1 Tax=Gossypium australe TaxID=47621 RepID=A0A5B6WMP4_9ROSI|nr:E3 ubiquitin-protein ligase COP1-like [Gossypium australe]
MPLASPSTYSFCSSDTNKGVQVESCLVKELEDLSKSKNHKTISILKEKKRDTKAYSRNNKCFLKKGFTLRESNHTKFMESIRKIAKSLNWEVFCDQKPTPILS